LSPVGVKVVEAWPSVPNVSYRGQLAVSLNLLERLVKAGNVRRDARRS
jgi:hypothetical protein